MYANAPRVRPLLAIRGTFLLVKDCTTITERGNKSVTKAGKRDGYDV